MEGPDRLLDIPDEVILSHLTHLLSSQRPNMRVNDKNSVFGKTLNKVFDITSGGTLIERKYVNSIWKKYSVEANKESTGQKYSRISRKRQYNQNYYSSRKRKHVNDSADSDFDICEVSNTEAHDINQEDNVEQRSGKTQEETVNSILQEFKGHLYTFATFECSVCKRMMYPSSRATHIINDKNVQEFRLFGCDDFVVGSKISVCKKCINPLKKGKVPAQAYFNGFQMPPPPEEIKELTEAECRLISQVKLFMKVFQTQKGRGQMALKGTCIHFPQSVDEVIKTLPLNSSTVDAVVITESRATSSTQYVVRSREVYKALQWLKQNNPLYANVQIEDRNNEELQIPELLLHDNVEEPSFDEVPSSGYVQMEASRYILRADFHQSSSIFRNQGNQCSGMSAAMLAYCKVQKPETWNSKTINQVLLTGDAYYQTKVPVGRTYLDAKEIEGEITCFGRFNVKLATPDYYWQGWFNKVPEQIEGSRLQRSLVEFLESEYDSGILTASEYCVAIFKDQTDVYLFDSHSRGPKGRIACSGKACIVKCPVFCAPNYISELLHHNLQPKQPFILDSSVAEQMRFMYQISPFVVSLVEEEEDEDALEEEQVLSFQQDIAQASTTFRMLNLDCVVDRDDENEPDVLEFLNDCRGNTRNVELRRSEGRPFYPDREPRLEELAFVKMFPFGKYGMSEERKVRVTVFEYFQQRILGSNRVFKSNEFLFYALNRIEGEAIRRQIAICGNMVRNNRDGEPIADDIVLPGMKNVHLYMSAIRGSASYWKRYQLDLFAMIENLGSPAIFLTFSIDDLNGVDSLTAIWKAENGAQADLPADFETWSFSKRRDLLNSNPVAAARHFMNKVNALFKTMRKHSVSIFGKHLQDYTYRVEFQARGSPHIHSLLWFRDMPEWDSDEGRAFIEHNISCSLDVPFQDEVTKYQSHSHADTCFIKSKFCRFGFPRQVSDSTRVLDEDEIRLNHGKFVVLKRSPPEIMINNYQKVLLKLIKANMDIQPVTSHQAICYYVAKYLGKAEPMKLRNEIQTALEKLKSFPGSNHQLKALKICSTIMTQREISTQEAGFRVCQLLLRRSTRSTVFLPSFIPEKRVRMVLKETLNGERPKAGLNIIERYENRPESLEELCLFEFAAHYAPKRRSKLIEDESDSEVEDPEDDSRDLRLKYISLQNNKGQMYKRKRPAVVKRPNFNPNEHLTDHLYSLILSYCPFRNEEDLFVQYENIPDAFNNLLPRFRTSADDAIINPNLGEQLQTEVIRIMETNFDSSTQCDDDDLEADLLDHEENVQGDNIFGSHDPVTSESLSELMRTLTTKQKEVVDKVRHAILNKDVQLLEFISGAGGTGKSHLINVLTKLIQTLEPQGNSALIKVAPTGMAATAIGAVTIHRAFSLGIEQKRTAPYFKLGGRKLQEKRNLFRNVRHVFIDEISMVPYETLRQIYMRLREIFSNEKHFGGVNVLAFGDLMQLKPVRGSWCFNQPRYLRNEVNLWQLLGFTELCKVMRQQEGNPFTDLLNRLRIGTLTHHDIELLRTRLINCSENLHLYPTVKQVDKFNATQMEKLKAQNVKVYTIHAQDRYASGTHFGLPAPKSVIPTNVRDCAGIPASISLSVGCKVTLRWNMDVTAGLCNGSTGTIRGFVWTGLRTDQLRTGDLPESVYVEFDRQVGIARLSRDQGFEACVRVSPRTFEFKGNRGNWIARNQIPLQVCFACTVHKSQGMSLDSCTAYLGSKIFCKGMVYVALSRIRSIDGLYIEEISENKLLVNKKGIGPCHDESLREICRLQLVNVAQITDPKLIENLIKFMIEYIMCRRCKYWVCLCNCKN